MKPSRIQTASGTLKRQWARATAIWVSIKFIAEALNLPKSVVNLKSGQTSRRKVLEISGADPSALAALI